MYLSVEHGVVVGDPLSLGQGGFVLIVEADDFVFLRGGEPVGADGFVSADGFGSAVSVGRGPSTRVLAPLAG
jgi:hypothetical protein